MSCGAAFVLTVAKVSAGGGAAYASYLEGRAQAPEQGDYYLKDGERVEAPGRWVLGPGGATALGVDRSAPVDGPTPSHEPPKRSVRISSAGGTSRGTSLSEYSMMRKHPRAATVGLHA